MDCIKMVVAMNPCRCGYFPDMQKCQCTQKSIEQYLGRISRPLLDRIDVCVEAPKLEFWELNGESEEESSECIRKRVQRVWDIQKRRYEGENFRFNSQIPSSAIRKYCTLSKGQERDMEEMYRKLNLTARSYHKILKVARTLADMEETEQIKDRHLREAVCYRSVDQKFWKRS